MFVRGFRWIFIIIIILGISSPAIVGYMKKRKEGKEGDEELAELEDSISLEFTEK